jgi:hypothetical protein
MSKEYYYLLKQKNFFGIPAIDFFRNSNDYEKLKTVVTKLTDKNCYISVLVEAMNVTGQEERIYRIIGEYNNLII